MSKWPIRWDLRTSESHPLQIDWISHANFKGKIGLTLCPGKYQPVSWTGGWNRDLKTDLDTLVEQGTSTVITLIDKNEMESLRVNNIGVIIEQMGMRWIHLPLEDTTAPNIVWMNKFLSVLYSITDELDDEELIVIHCKGGLGRAGTCAALILHAQGLTMDWAIDLVRMVRSKDCINFEQYDFLKSNESLLKTLRLIKGTQFKTEVKS
tara:strand:- start:164 stop:787 length:624 start_codon:yes stop_codon:yes gene_type:complete